jgi:hypothetical protein
MMGTSSNPPRSGTTTSWRLTARPPSANADRPARWRDTW